MWYVVKEAGTENYARGTGKGYRKPNLGPIDKIPPKLYSYGSARQLRSFYANQTPSIHLLVLPFNSENNS